VQTLLLSQDERQTEYIIEPVTWHDRSMVKEPAGGCTSATVDTVLQVPAVIDPLAAIVMGQAIPPWVK
jgi:hypothetical protein